MKFYDFSATNMDGEMVKMSKYQRRCGFGCEYRNQVWIGAAI